MPETDFAAFRVRLEKLEVEARRLEMAREALTADLARALASWTSEAVKGWEPREGDPAMHIALTRSDPWVQKVTATAPLLRGMLCFRESEYARVTFDPRLRPEDAEHPSCVLPPDVWVRLEQLWRADPREVPEETP